MADKHFVCHCDRCRAETTGKLGAGLNYAAAAGAKSTASAAAAASASPSSSSAVSSSPAIDASRVDAWHCLGAVFCPRCKEKSQEKLAAQLEKELGLDDSKGKKKKKKPAPAAAVATAEAGNSAASSSSSGTSSEHPAFLASLSSREQGLLIWRGVPAELQKELEVASGVTPALLPSEQPKAWHCSRSACGAKLTLSEVDSILEPLHSLYRRAASRHAELQ